MNENDNLSHLPIEELESNPDKPTEPVGVRSLRELLDRATHQAIETSREMQDPGIAEPIAFPFLGLIGQEDMKLALLLNIINPLIGGVLLIGPRGTGKTTAARSLMNLLPEIERSLCQYGCLPRDIESGGIDAVCPNCARKFGEGESLSTMEPAHLVELPLNARLEDVVGGVDDRASIHHRLRLKRGILAQADQNILYVDEVNLLPDEIVDAILDAAAMGSYTVRRGPMSATYRAKFTLIGSMNPEEGNLRPQILDRFGLRVIVCGLEDARERQNAYQRAVAFRSNPRMFVNQFSEETEILREEILASRETLNSVTIPDSVFKIGLNLIQQLKIESLRAEITLFESARAYTAADNRLEVTPGDLQRVAPMALRLRQSPFIRQYLQNRIDEDKEMITIIDSFFSPTSKGQSQ